MRARNFLAASRAALLLVGGLGWLAMAQAQTTFDYSLQPRTFRACRLLMPGQSGDVASGTTVPHSLIFEGMRRYVNKPSGWDIENPLAPPSIVAGQPNLTKSSPTYWEVPLTSNTAPQLEGFDLIYIYASGINLASGVYRDAMLRAAHEGAVLWIDQPYGAAGTNVAAFAPPGGYFAPGTPPFRLTGATQTTGSYRRADDRDSLLTNPFRLQDVEDMQFLGVYPRVANANWPAAPTVAVQSAHPAYVTCTEPGLQRVSSVWDGSAWLPDIVVYRYGAGAVLITAGDVGWDMVNWWYTPARPKPLRYEAADLKFGWNVLALTSGWPEQRGSVSQRGYSVTSAQLPLDIRWQYPDRFEPATSNPLGTVIGSPVVFGGMVYALSLGRPAAGGVPARAPLLLCFDKDPAHDLDMDGQADDGVQDYSLGRSYDLVWYTSLNAGGGDWTARNSAPTLTTLSGLLGGGLKLQVALVSVVQRAPSGHAAGYVRCYNATVDPRVLSQVPTNDINGNPLSAAYSTPGALIWQRQIDSYDGAEASPNGQVIEVTTPAVHRNYVYVLSSEVDEDADGAASVTMQDAYGRAHCFLLNHRWDLDQNGSQWTFPEATDNPNGDGDVAGAGAGDDNATPEPMKLLPAFQPPNWVAGLDDGTNDFDPRPEIPPLPSQKPVVDQPVLPRTDYYVDAYLHIAAPTSVNFTGGVLQTVNRGFDCMLLPCPKPVTAAPYTDSTNDNCWLLYLPEATNLAETTVTSVVRSDDNQIDATGDLYQSGTYIYLKLNSSNVRELCLPSRTAAAPWNNPLQTAYYVTATVNYTIQVAGVPTPATPVNRTVYGMVRQRLTYGVDDWSRTAARSVENGRGFFSFDTPETDRGILPTPSSSYVQARRQDNGTLQWQFRPAYALPDPNTGAPAQARQILGKAGLAVDRTTDTTYATLTAAVSPDAAAPNPRAAVPQVLGLNTTPRLEVQLRGGGPDTRLLELPVPTVQTIQGGAVVAVPASAYTIDDESRSLTFDVAQAGWVNGTVGALWGKPIWVTYNYTSPPTHATGTAVSNELHILPDLVRFQYTPGLIRLRHTVVQAGAGALTATLPNGLPVAGLAEGEAAIPQAVVPGGANPTFAGGFLAQGLVNASTLTMPGGEPLRPGSDLLISYTYWDTITNTARTVSGERHQVPLAFGESVSSPAVAGATVHVGTEGYHPTRIKDPADGPVVLDNTDLHVPGAAIGPILAPNGGRKSLLSVLWDPISRITRASLAQTAYPEPATYGLASGADQGTPVTTASPAVDGETVVVGARMMTQLSRVASYQGQGLGFVSALSSQRTLICDTTRLIEVTGQTPSWICVGSLAPDYHAAYHVTTQGAEELKPTPFSRPAKATYLDNGHILVADSGNNRVLEIDREGRQLWPLDANGYDYYSSPNNTRLSLERPSDVYRYYTTIVGGVAVNSPHGDLLPGTTSHTVVADPGNNRVVDIVTTVNALGQQSHQVFVLTPDFTRVGTQPGQMRLAYTKAQPIFRPDNGGLVGYLCVASNLNQLVVVEAGSKRVNPPGTGAPAPGAYNWNWWAWLYDSNLSDTNAAPDNPLVFRNLRHAEFTQEEDIIYLTVTCGQYAGRYQMAQAGTPHNLATQGAGVFEFAIRVSGDVSAWSLLPAVDGSGTPLPDDPIWRFTGLNYTFSDPGAGVRRYLSNINYTDRDGVGRWMPMGWTPVAAQRIASDLRPTAAGERMQRHLVTNYAELIQNLTRANANSNVAPASLYSSVFVVETDDRVNNDPNDDLHDIDRREVVPDPNELDWPDPFNQPTYAERR